ncbi:MAG: hypothetical protein A2087_10040 [Spirochaetes bacterium GWD1_61_31]|nr:MAG: hypothetical protein A2Y37_01860 [Spirochaetes bacterium GWB1_60_80]OHD35553.1 MAG: hypothetical protein A2004_06750 [Spirochaetes bacterium GWC1_61_12]OHD40620.1 MAG: hypothetical protein A2087_10040 [Spirochaetes bacterium GWD1_61_31]OHD43892.1 MAG: hypothetical protein A2Y35_12390 [Spirochaetes bacterium GWE1_60_18]OHD59763.1 MAG: hypothetical protein A2Y32_02245 [Spirochaetes bacterium GWF1_60_12]HAP43512.1 hypothetical protein [Spirochaetaceae bacterium]
MRGIVKVVEKATGFFNNLLDMTARKEVEQRLEAQVQEKEVLIKEVYHRMKNGIASVESLLSMQLDKSTNNETRSALTDSIGRIRSMRLLYDKLLLDGQADVVSSRAYLANLVRAVSDLFPSQDYVVVHTELKDLKLPSKLAFTIGLIANELITNSYKYAFAGRARRLPEHPLHAPGTEPMPRCRR